MGKLILKEFKETAKIFIPVYIASLLLIYLRRDSIINLYYHGFEYHNRLENLAIITCIVIIILPLFLSVKRFYDCVKNKEINCFSSSVIIISKVLPMTLWSMGILLLDFGLSQPTVLDKMINNPNYFDDISYYLFNPFPGGFDIELIDFYAIRTIVDSISIFFFLIIIFTVFYICVCISHAYCFGSKVLTAAFIYASFHIIVFGYGGIAIPLLHLSDYFFGISELYSGVLSTCVGIIIEIILAVILLFICRTLLEKALLKNSEN